VEGGRGEGLDFGIDEGHGDFLAWVDKTMNVFIDSIFFARDES
jgi:hypothetical protein